MSGEGGESETQPEMSESQSEPNRSDDLEALNVRLRNENVYEVGNPDTGNAYVVNMHNADHDGTMTCTCPDYRFRAQEGEHRACKHIQKVIEVSPDRITADKIAFEHLSREYQILSEKVDSLSQQLTSIVSTVHEDNGTQSQTDYSGQQQSVPASDAQSGGQKMEAAGAQEAADKLQRAFNDVVEGFDVQDHNGKVWVNKTPAAPENLPGPGNVETFTAFLQSPDMMQYDPDSGPGQYWKNYIEPDEVDQYISEVLE
jgi:hypothetical protein